MTLYVYHYFDAGTGPFQNLSALSTQAASEISNRIREAGQTFASRRTPDYMSIRTDLEAIARKMFIHKGGSPLSHYPHYMTLGACDWLMTWYQNPAVLIFPLDELPDERVSFTYGDLFPTMRVQDQKPYRKQVYTKLEILKLIDVYGFPQVWNNRGDNGPERYIEVQIWDEAIINRMVTKAQLTRQEDP